jgi:hypothetical protein
MERCFDFRKHGIKHSIIRLIEWEGVTEARPLFFHKEHAPFVKDDATLKMGSYRNGHWCLSFAATAQSSADLIFSGVLNLDNFEKIFDKPIIESERYSKRLGKKIPMHTIFGEITPISASQFRSWKCGNFVFYDHRPVASPKGEVRWMRKEADGRTWEHISIYPTTDAPIGRLFVGKLDAQYNLADEEILDRVTIAHVRMSRKTRIEFYIAAIVNATDKKLAEARTAFAELRAVWQGTFTLAERCDAGEKMIIVALQANLLSISPEMDKLWGRYNAIKERALRTDSENEKQISWRKAVSTLQRIINSIKMP